MRPSPRWLMLLACLALTWPAHAAVPDIVTRGTNEALRDCRSVGGRPDLRPGYQTAAELNGDGQPDYIIDLAGLNCDGAAAYFCGSAGCPVTVYLSSPGGYRATHIGHVQAWALEGGGPLPVLKLSLHGGACGRAGVEACERRMAWNGRELAALGRAGPPRPPARSEQNAPAAMAPGWALRHVAGHSPVAVVAGPGNIANLAMLCQEGRAIAAVTLRQRPRASSAMLIFSDGRQRVELFFRLMPGGGAAWYADLTGGGLPALLLQRGNALILAMNNDIQGPLSRQGAGTALRQALSPCLRLR